MAKPFRHLALLLCLASASVSTMAAPASTVKDAGTVPAAEGQLPLDDLRTFARVLEQIRLSYVEEVDDKTLLENAIRGMLGELDPHSAYLDERDFTDLQSMATGEFGGIGIEVGMNEGLLTVVSPIDDTPASRAGIQAGDVIIKLGDKSVQGMSLDEAVGIMRGTVGESLDFTIVRKTVEKPFKLTIVRDVIKVYSVRQKMLEPGFAYIRIAQFQVNTGEELKKAVDALKKDASVRGVVLDLRNNPGGVLQAAVEVSDAFLNQGVIVYTKGRMPESNISYSAKPGDLLDGAPMVVLVNDGSASAAEIVAGALQDQHRAVVLGTDSFGKGSVQTVIPISDTKAIKLTTALYYTPGGRSIQAEGIKPDIVVERAQITSVQEPDLRAAEASLDKHLGNGNKADAKAGKGKVDGKTDAKADREKLLQGEKDLQKKDNQLHDALNMLKAMQLGRNPKT